MTGLGSKEVDILVSLFHIERLGLSSVASIPSLSWETKASASPGLPLSSRMCKQLTLMALTLI